MTKGHADQITDYNVVTDTVQLENAAFTAIKTTDILDASQFRIVAKTLDENNFITTINSRCASV